MLRRRAEETLERLADIDEDALVYVFSHGQFIQAVRSLAINREKGDRETMRDFWQRGNPAIANGELVRLEWTGNLWR